MNKKHLNKIIIIVVVIGLIAAFRIFHLEEYLSLSFIKESQESFQLLYSQHRLSVIAGFMLVYIVVTSLSLPGGAVMGLAAGALFGLFTGAVAVSFASTIGATIACFVSRFMLRDWIQNRFGDRLETVNEGIEREGAFYLFTLRLIPVFPFWLINLIMGLTKMPLKTYYWVSQIGMLPGTLVFVNAGKELGKIESLPGIFSPGLILSFALLGVFPIATKKLLAFYKSRKESQLSTEESGG
jgi:uncharacterized membrane protein YdjX (TVP38/TMEM64 family)